MAAIPCSNKVDCPGTDFPISNYSSEGPEQEPTFCSVVFPDGWTKGGCMTAVCVPESQNAADLLALQAIATCDPDPPPPPFCPNPPCVPVVPRFCNTEQQCCCVGQGGTEFCYTTPAGTFCADTQEAADAQALAYGCENCGNEETSVRLGALDGCTCLASTYSESIAFEGNTPVTWLVIDGELPDGLTLNSFTGNISGTTLDAGTFVFTVKAFLADGNYATRTYSIYVIEITTATLDEYVLGEAYSFQMQAAGGSGNYLWRVNQGSLPTGLTMSSTGLISGTPTAAGSAAIQFSVIDTTCENSNRSFFTPLIATTSTSLTTIRTRRGYGEYTSGGTGDWYKRVTYTGYTTQTAKVRPSPGQGVEEAYCGGARYLYSGSSAINNQGQFISSHRKDLYVNCLQAPEFSCRDIFENPLINVSKLLGYCWPLDPQTCLVCSEEPADWVFKRDDATHSAADFPYNMVNANTTEGGTLTPTSYSLVRDTGDFPASNPFYLGYAEFIGIPNPINFPTSELDSTEAYYVNLFVDYNYTATLSEPFTEADQIAGQVQYTSNGRTSENRPDYLTWQNDYINNSSSRYTDASFTLNCSNLVDGESYTVNYEFWRNDGVVSQQSQVFTASGTTHTLFGTLPTPPTNRTITLRNVRIGYTP